MIDTFWHELPFIAFGALLAIIVYVILGLCRGFFGEHASYERRWSRRHRAALRERARLGKRGTP